MHKGSLNYFIGVVLAKPLFYYGIGASVNTALQLSFLWVSSGGMLAPEQLPSFIERVIFIYLPIIPPVGLGDWINLVLNVILASILGILRAGFDTMKWSAGMQGR